jgi:hypothetical protein
VQEAVLRAGREASVFARRTESQEDRVKLEQMAKSGRLELLPFTDRARAEQLAMPAIQEYVKQVGAEAIHARIVAL